MNIENPSFRGVHRVMWGNPHRSRKTLLGDGLCVSKPTPALIARRFSMDKTNKVVLVGLAVVVALCAAYYFVLRPMINDARLEDCLHPKGGALRTVGMNQETRDNCFKQYGNK